MKLAGSRSWRFAAEASELLHLALRVRDGAALEVPEAADVPPVLLGEPFGAGGAGRSGGVGSRGSADGEVDPLLAGAEWLTWWREAVDLEARRVLLRPDQVTEPWGKVSRRLRAELRRLATPPRFDGLADRPSLQAAARVVGRTPHGWVDRELQAHRHSRALIDWPVVDAAVHQVAAATGAPVNGMNGCALVLLVRGVWWRQVGPGVVLASVAAAGDPGAAGELVRAAFRTGLQAPDPTVLQAPDPTGRQVPDR